MLHAQKAEFRIHSLTADCSGVLGESAHEAPTQNKQGLVAYAWGPTMGQPEAGDKQKFWQQPPSRKYVPEWEVGSQSPER